MALLSGGFLGEDEEPQNEDDGGGSDLARKMQRDIDEALSSVDTHYDDDPHPPEKYKGTSHGTKKSK